MDLFNTIVDIVKGSPHCVVFLVLFLCGLGLPIPEEVTIIVAAWTTVQGWAPLHSMFLVALAGILAGDVLIYLVGRYLGYRLVRLPYFRRVLSEERLAKVDRFFDRYGDWTVFIARFFAGFRAPCYFIAGISRLAFHVFLFMDFLAALLSAGLTFLVIRSFGKEIEQAIRYLRRTEYFVVIVLVVVVTSVVAWRLWKMRRAKALAAAKPAPTRLSGEVGN
jgi:membrane protein DedA with SNARE-associated domain